MTEKQFLQLMACLSDIEASLSGLCLDVESLMLPPRHAVEGCGDDVRPTPVGSRAGGRS